MKNRIPANYNLKNPIPVNTRRHTQDDYDPYIDDESYEDNTVCRECGHIYMQGRWYSKDQLPEQEFKDSEVTDIQCPACHKLQDREVPGGVLRLSGDFVWKHKDEIMNLVRNETTNAQAANPLERIMDIESIDNVLEITTTNEKLAQRIGKAISKAYSGHIEYKWSTDTKLARVNWHREK